jgi:hypothetical protein
MLWVLIIITYCTNAIIVMHLLYLNVLKEMGKALPPFAFRYKFKVVKSKPWRINKTDRVCHGRRRRCFFKVELPNFVLKKRVGEQTESWAQHSISITLQSCL